ncbi:hypothetical protein B0H10DRAFT_1976516 [Mycena sp. CBHHK59/15]|nr:hypothetical protein B0H10DRAFT_1976516 [Mycena sp. CBHHK59/15]
MDPKPAQVIEIDDSGDEGPPRTSRNPSNNPEQRVSDFESDDDDEETEVEQKPLISPSTNIQADFRLALEEGFDFDGVFAFSSRYTMGNAPNPCLNIDGLGTVGLPLNERDARAIISASVPVSASKDESAPSGIWEMSSEKVHFDNPAWATWIQNTAGLAASTALTAYSAVRPTYTLRKLVLHEKGSHRTNFKEPSSDDESNTKIGDLIAILPCLFDGAQLQLRHAGETKSLDLAHQSRLSTSIVAAYSGVEHTLSGVSAGYRLSLVYDIVQPMTHAQYRPTLPEMQGATQKLRNVMLSWKQDVAGNAPQFLACLLQHKYAKAPKFRAKSLTGADALLMSHLRPLARELKFRIYLAHIVVTVSATSSAEDYGYGGYGGYRRGYGRRGWGCAYDDSDEEIYEEAFETDEGSEEEKLNVTQVVDLQGMPVHVDLEFEADDLVNGSVTDDHPDKEDFERDDRTSASRVKTYRRTVLLIWPKNGDIDSTVKVGDVYEYACNALQNSLTVAPTDKEKKLVDKLLECCRIHPQPGKLQRVVQVLRESADRWNDVQTLLRALKTCGVDKNNDLMGVEGFISAYQAFGWDSLKDFYNDAMKNDESNGRRHALLARLTRMAAEENDAEVSVWCKNQEECVLRSLSKIDPSQIPWLTQLALARGGEFLRDIIFPQLQAQKLDKTFWIPFVKQLQQSMTTIPTTSLEVVGGLIMKCVSETVQNLPAFPTRTIAGYYSYHPAREEKSSDAILEVIKLCVETKNSVLCDSIFTKMREAMRSGTFVLLFPPWLYYFELCASLTQYLQSVPTLATTFQPFFVDAIDAMVSSTRTTPDGRAFTPCSLTEQHRVTIMNAARKAGGLSVLKQRLTSDRLKGHDSATLQALVRVIVKENQQQKPQDDVAKQDYKHLLITLVRAAIDAFDTSRLKRSPYPSYGYGTMTLSDQMIGLVKFCFEVGAQSQCQRLLLRLVPPPTGSTVQQHVSGVLAPFLPILRQYLVTQRLDFRTDPYKMFSAAVVKAFADKVMSQKPTEVVPVTQLQGIGCNVCSECRELKAFFLSEKETISFARVQGIRTHLERHLGTARSWGVVWETIKGRSPHTLKITKPASMTALGLWSGNSQTGKTLLAGLGDVATQTYILGPDYAWVHARITGTHPGPLPLANQNLNAQKRPATTTPIPTIPVAKKARTS